MLNQESMATVFLLRWMSLTSSAHAAPRSSLLNNEVLVLNVMGWFGNPPIVCSVYPGFRSTNTR